MLKEQKTKDLKENEHYLTRKRIHQFGSLCGTEIWQEILLYCRESAKKKNKRLGGDEYRFQEDGIS